VLEPEVLVEGDVVQITLRVRLSRDIMEAEQAIQSALNEGGCKLTREALNYLDTDGSPIETGGVVWRSKGKNNKKYQTPYGAVQVERHVYQKSGGGKTYCPLEHNARIIRGATPLFAKQISNKFARNDAREVQRDLEENHGRKIAVSFVQNLSQSVAAIIEAREEEWSYHVPELPRPVATIAISLDGTCMLMCQNRGRKQGTEEQGTEEQGAEEQGDEVGEKGGWREAMTGSLSLYDADGERMHTIYLGAAPQYGKTLFLARLTREIELLKERYPDANYIGIADGAERNWRYLEAHTGVQILDYFHAAAYLGAAARAFCPDDIAMQKQWLDTACHMLKHEKNAAARLLEKMQKLKDEAEEDAQEPPPKWMEELSKTITYFTNHLHQMDYPKYRRQGYPIGSGVIEAACKTLIKQRLCQSGMRWKEAGAKTVITLRAFDRTKGRWQQFWTKLNQYGVPAI